MMKYLFLSMAVFFMQTSCNSSANHKISIPEETFNPEAQANNSSMFAGDYKGKLLCTGNTFIKTNLRLEADHTFEMNEEYEDAIANKKFNSTGTFTINKDTLVLSFSGDTTHAVFYQINKNKLIQLDTDGNPATGTIAEKYILHKSID